jgi:hypothetical protein
MRAILTTAALVVGLGLSPGPASAACTEINLVQGWYAQYLHRPADPLGLQAWGGQLRGGTDPDCVLGQILGSDEYYKLHGSCPEGFIAGLHQDLLGQQPSAEQMNGWMGVWRRNPCRAELAKGFLRSIHGPGAAASQAPSPAAIITYRGISQGMVQVQQEHTMTIYNGCRVTQATFVWRDGSWHTCGGSGDLASVRRHCP